jgi:hypothetical protein
MMAVFEARYVTAHIYSAYKTRAHGWRAGPGGWARVPQCSCGWNHTHSIKFGFKLSPNGSIFSDHYATDQIAHEVWLKEHMDLQPRDEGQLLLQLAST